MATRARRRIPAPLEGEDIDTSHWEDAHHWMSIYDDLIRFKRGLLGRVERELPTLNPIVQKAADQDLEIIRQQLAGYQARLDLWYRRVWQLKGLRLDAEASAVRHESRQAHLTKREFQLLQFLLDHHHRFFTADQIKARAWAEPALFPEEVRNYVRRVRRILADLAVPADVVNRPHQGYSLVFRQQP